MRFKKGRTIRDYPNYSIRSDGRITNSKGHEKVQEINHKGYMKVDLYKDGVRSTQRVHRLVAEAYIPNPENKPDVNHKDGNKLNNDASNLEWCTKSENMRHAYDTGLAKPHASYGMRGHKNPNGGRKGIKVMISETGEIFDSIKDCAEAINGRDRGICDCLNGRQCTHRGYHFERI